MHATRIREFTTRVERDTAERVFATRHGEARVSDSIRDVYDRNYLAVDAPSVAAAELAADAEAALDGHFHRRVVVADGPPGLAEDFLVLGYVLSTHLVLAHTREPDRLVDTAMIHEVELERVLPARTEATMREPWGDESIAAQLNDAKRHIAAAVPTRFFAAISGGEVAGWCELYVQDGVAQIEDVEVLAEYRGRGLGRAIVQHALQEARRGAGLVFLEALADDWPRELYAKLGFTLADRIDYYTRLPHPLTRIRLRTPRLELRLATVAELRRLFLVAEAGIGDPAEMPIDPAAIQFVAFLGGEPIGVQRLDVHADHVATGSWLSRAHHGRGLDTEMHAAVLTYAFGHLGARVARPGELDADLFVSPVPVEVIGAAR